MPAALFTDLYELTMIAGYLRSELASARATFDLFFRRPPKGVPLIVAAGQELALRHLEDLRVRDDEIRYLRDEGTLPAEAIAAIAELRFTGDVDAVPEGTPVFADEPVLRVEAPLAEAQLVETALLNLICYSSLVASNAVEVAEAARGRSVLEFGARRAHGPDGARSASRAAYIGGCDATSNTAAAMEFAIPVAGTQAHAWVMAFPSELDAFRAYAATFPDDSVLLVDTYDALAIGVPNAITVAGELRAGGHELRGIRIDSGDLVALSEGARRRLDEAGFADVRIVVSGDLDAHRVRELLATGAPIDSFGVGTALVTAAQDPTISGVYKLASLEGVPVMKLSGTPEKGTNPGCKQVWRSAADDVIGLSDEDLPGRALLQPVMREGSRVAPPERTADVRERCRAEVAAVRPAVLEERWSVSRSERLDALRRGLAADLSDGARDR